MLTKEHNDLLANIHELMASVPKVYRSAKILHQYGMIDESPEDFLERYIKQNPRINEAVSYATKRGLIDGTQWSKIKGIDLTIQSCSWFDESGLKISAAT